jgi:sirohydrochlorin ferrochelatase
MKPTPEAELILAQVMLAALKREGTDPQAIAFWEEAVRDCEEALKEKPE